MIRGFWNRIHGPMWLALAHGCHGAFQWLFILILTRIYGLGDLGTYSTIMAVMAPIVMVAGLNSRGVQLADVSRRWSVGQVLVVRILGMVVALAAVLCCAVITGDVASPALWMVLFVRSAAESIAEPIHTFLIASNRYRSFALTFLLRSTLSVAAFAVLAYLGSPLIWSLLGWASVWVIVLIGRDLKLGGLSMFVRKGSCGLRPSRANLNALWRFILASTPLAIVGVINLLYTSVPTLVLQRHRGFTEVGEFAASNYISLAFGLVIGSVTLSSARSSAGLYAQGRHEMATKRVHRQLLFVLTLIIPMIMLMYFFGESLVSTMYGTHVAGYRGVLVAQVVSVGLMSAGNVCGVAATASGNNRIQVRVGLVSLGVAVVLSLMLIGRLAALGAALATLATYGTKALLLYLILPKRPPQGESTTSHT